MANTNGANRGGIKGRLGALEHRLGVDQEPDPATVEARERHLRNCEDGWRKELENIAIDLAVNSEPGLTFRDDAFYTLDGRLAASRTVHDIQALMGPETEAQREAIPPERWDEFLAEDVEAKRLVSELFEMAEDADVPEDYWAWLGAWPHKPEILAEGYHAGRIPGASEGPLPSCDDGPLLDPEEWERARRLAWVLIHAGEARKKLEKLCRRRDSYLQSGGFNA